MPDIAAATLQRITFGVLRALGTPEDTAHVVAEGLVDSNLAGLDSHGVIRLPQYAAAVADGTVDPSAVPVIERDAGGVTTVDGRRAFGHVVARFAVDTLAGRLVESGVGVAVVVAHHAYHVGRLGAYVQRLAERGLVAMAMVNNHGARHWVAPHGGRARRLSTNPIAFAAPVAGGRPLLVDMTSSATAEGKIRVLRSRGLPVPDGWMIDGDGRVSTDPAALYADPPGALLPLGGQALGHKGFGLSLMVEVLAGALSGAGCSRPGAAWPGNGFFCLALSPVAGGGGLPLAQQVADLLAWVKDSPPAAGSRGVLAPGEPEWRTAEQRAARGVPVDDGTWRAICDTAARYGVPCDVTSK